MFCDSLDLAQHVAVPASRDGSLANASRDHSVLRCTLKCSSWQVIRVNETLNFGWILQNLANNGTVPTSTLNVSQAGYCQVCTHMNSSIPGLQTSR